MAENDANCSSTALPLLLPPPPGFEEKQVQVLNPEPFAIVMRNRRNSTLSARFFDGPKFGLPNRWLIERRPRTSAKYLGKMDQFFYEPNTGRQFRSVTSVEQHLGRELPEVRKLMKRQSPRVVLAPTKLGCPAMPIPIDDGHNNDHPQPKLVDVTPQSSNFRGPKSYRMKKKRSYCLDFGNPPKSVTWALTDPTKDIWSPQIDGTRISDADKNYWVDTFTAINRAKTYASTSKVSQDNVKKQKNPKTLEQDQNAD